MHLEDHKKAEIKVRAKDFMDQESKKPFGYPSHVWVKWASIIDSFTRLGVNPGSKILDLGCGAGWTANFLAESGYEVTGLDIVPGNMAAGKKRAKFRGLSTKFIVSDMDSLNLAEKFDGVLVFDSLHHTTRQKEVISRISQHLKPNGWVLFGEPSYLHSISPEARRVTKEEGIVERGIFVSSIKRDCKKAGMKNFRRFFEGTRPYESRVKGFSWQLIRLVSANILFAPQASIWVAAQKTKK